MLKPINLKVNYTKPEYAVADTQFPVFTWGYEDLSLANKKQSGYRIIVSHNGVELWDSGYCESDSMRAVYSGEQLPSGAVITWKIQLTDNLGKAGKEVESSFKTVCFDALEGEWIEPDFDCGHSVVNFKKEFCLKEMPERAVLYYCGLGLSKPYINGTETDNFRLQPAYTNYAKQAQYVTQPIDASMLKIGKNEIEISVASGWRKNYGKYLDNMSSDRAIEFMGDICLWAKLVIYAKDGTTQSYTTDLSWSCAGGNITYSHLFNGEVFDETAGEREWKNVKLSEFSSEELIPQYIEPVCVKREIKPVISYDRNGIRIYDFGENLAGVPHLKAKGFCKNVAFVLRHAEEVTETGELFTDTLRSAGAKTNCVSRIFLENKFNVTLEDENGEKVSVVNRKNTEKGTEILFIAGEIKALDSKKFKVVPFEGEEAETIALDTIKNFDGDAVLTNVVENNDFEKTEKTVVIENEYYTVTANENGITAIYDKKIGKTVAEKSTYYVGEFVLGHDEGSPWATHSDDMRRQPMSRDTKLIDIEKGKDYQELIFYVKPGDLCAYAVNSFKSEYRVRLQRGEYKVRFNTDIFWDTQNYRLRIAFPVAVNGKHIYEIPYGQIERKPYELDLFWTNGSSNWASAAGDWPAINWAGIEAEDMSVALLNKGTPSYQINTDSNGMENIYLTVLRSPSVGTYLHDPGTAYSMVDYDGMRDAGEHSFEYAFVSYPDGFDKNSVVTDGIAYNIDTVAFSGDIKDIKLPEIVSDDVRIATIKHSQKGDLLIYRLVEYHGKNSEFTVKIPEGMKVSAMYEMNLNEEIVEKIPFENNTAAIKTGKFKIKTIAFDAKKTE